MSLFLLLACLTRDVSTDTAFGKAVIGELLTQARRVRGLRASLTDTRRERVEGKNRVARFITM